MNKNLFGCPRSINLNQVFSKQTMFDLLKTISNA